MKLIQFNDATSVQPGGQVVDKKLEDVHFHKAEAGVVAVCVEVTKEDLKELRSNGKFYIVMGPGFVRPPQMVFSIKPPFTPAPAEETKPKSKLVDLNGNPLN
jgi:hypothetical protein